MATIDMRDLRSQSTHLIDLLTAAGVSEGSTAPQASLWGVVNLLEWFADAVEQPDGAVRSHAGHTAEIAAYGDPERPVNVAIECVDCGVVLLDFDNLLGDQ